MHRRIQKVQQFLEKEGLDLFVVDHGIVIYYLAGVKLSAGRLIVDRQTATLFVDARYFELCQKKATVEVQLVEKPGQVTYPLDGKRAGFDGANTSFQNYNRLKEKVGDGLVAYDQPILHFRQIKEPKELAILRHAGHLATRGYEYLLSLLAEGISEEKLATELELFWRREGGEKLAFDAIVAFGENSSQPHYQPGTRQLKKGEVVLVDIGVVFEQYHSDMTRVVFWGEVEDPLPKIYEIVYQAQQAAMELCRPGVAIKEVDRAARQVIEKAGYGEFFPHSLGHGVGLEVHELPVLKSDPPHGEVVLEEGMVITIEPGIYLPNCGGVRLEEMIAITAEGFENLLGTPVASSPPIR